ncbi:MAG: hypothetical protein M1839_003215 [Geoglossum umbratile]|nr:MAG: hypothetical protein M1839_003215 [Geoglossum umbratile]
MATFDPIPYTYVPTAPRFKSTKAPYNRTPKQVSILDKIQRIKASGAALGMPRPPVVANDSRNDGPGIRKTSTIYSGNDKEEEEEEEEEEEDDDDDDLPTIEDLLYTTLKKEGFATEDSSLDHRVRGVGEVAVEERGGFTDYNRSALGGDLGSSPDNPIVLPGDDGLSTFEAEVDHSSLHAENAGPDANHFNSPETTVDSITLAPPSSLDGWYDIDDYPETVQRLHDRIDTGDLDTHRARSETATSHSARPRSSPPRRSRESTGNRLSQENRLHAGQSTADEREYEDELVRPALNTDTFDKGERQQQEAEAEGEVDKDDDEDDSQPQQRVNSVAVLTTERVGDTHLSGKGDENARPAKRQRPLPYSDSSPEPSHDEAGSYNDSYSDDELNNAKAKSDKDDGRPRPAKRKRPSSTYDGPTQWKHKNYLQYRSSRQRKLRSKSHQHYPKSHSLLDQGLRVAAGSSAEGQLPLPAPSAPQATDTNVSPDCCNPSPRDVLPTLTEVTFRPHSLYCCSFTAVIRDGCDGRGVSFSQLAQLIKSIGYMGKIDDFTIKPIEHHSFLLTGFSRYTSSQPLFSGATLSTATEAGRNHIDATRTRPQNGRAVDARALASRRSEPPSSDDDGSLSDSDPESGSGDDGCLSEAEQGHSSTSKRSRWSDLDEQRLLAYKKEGKSWEWIFGKFPGRTRPAIRTRWNMVRPRDK